MTKALDGKIDFAEVADGLGYAHADGYITDIHETRGAQRSIYSDLSSKCGVTAAYFRGAVPLVAFAQAESADEVTRTHRRLWNFGRVPVLIASTPDDVSALSCIVGPSKDRSAILRTARRDEDVVGILHEFSRYSIETGKAAKAYPAQFARRHRVDSVLLENLRQLRQHLLAYKISEQSVAELIGRSIFIRYLEDRDILSISHVQDLSNCDSYVDALRTGSEAVQRLFQALAERFNGDVFSMSVNTNSIPAKALPLIADFFAGSDLQTGQGHLWPYDFSIVPTELVSTIYEQLLADTQRNDAAYYTPQTLVNLVLDEVLPWDGPSSPTRVLDPACGSGIFLSESFERLAHRQEIERGEPASYRQLSNLLTSSIFGVDKSLPAVQVAAFSLYLKLLDRVDPPTAWREVRLPNLVGTNLIEADYFSNHVLANAKFDVIVGNPPWKSSLTPAAARYVQGERLQIPDRQVAHAFLWRSREQTAAGGLIGIVLPSKLLHNRSGPAVRARARIFSEISVRTVVDLSPLRKSLFGKGTSPACVFIVEATEKVQNDLLHVSPSRNPLSSATDGFVVDQDRVQRVEVGRIVADDGIWKTLLWGQSADRNLVTKLRRKFDTLETVRRRSGWVVSAGYQASGGDQNDASHIADLLSLPTAWVESLRLTAKPTDTVMTRVMHRPRDARIYKAPHLVMRKGFDDYPTAAFVDFDAAFTDGLFGIAGDSEGDSSLRAVAALLNSDVARYWLFMTSSSWGVEREQIHLSEYLSTPVPSLDSSTVLKLDSIQKRAAVGDGSDAGLEAELNSVVFQAYGLNEREIQLVRDTLNITIDEYRRGPDSVAYLPPQDAELDLYTLDLSKQLTESSVVPWTVEISERLEGYVVARCTPSNLNVTPKPSHGVRTLLRAANAGLQGWSSAVTILHPAVTLVEGSSVYLVKPDERRCWQRSVAISDAANVFEAVSLAPAVDDNYVQ